VELGLKTVQLDPATLPPIWVESISMLVLADKFQESLARDKAFENRTWPEFLSYLTHEELYFSTQMLTRELMDHKQ
jgi:hypothetical protein